MARKRALGSFQDYKNIHRIAVELRKHGYLQSYQTDLTKHDKATLRESTGPYLWAIRAHGTHLLTPKGACYGTGHGRAWGSMRKTFAPPVAFYYAEESGRPPRPISGREASRIADRWEKACKVRRSMWTGKPIRHPGDY